jgi:hypothetical protein
VLGLLATVIAARSKQAERATKKRHAHDKNETRQRRGGDRECDERRSRAARSTHARRTSRLPEADPRAWLACRERGGGVAASALVERSGAKRSDDRKPPPGERNTHIPRAVHDLLDCGGDNHRGDLARGHHMPPALRSLAPCGTADSEAQLASRSSQLAQLAPRAIRIGGAPGSRLACRRQHREVGAVLRPLAAQELVIVMMTHGRTSCHT